MRSHFGPRKEGYCLVGYCCSRKSSRCKATAVLAFVPDNSNTQLLQRSTCCAGESIPEFAAHVAEDVLPLAIEQKMVMPTRG